MTGKCITCLLVLLWLTLWITTRIFEMSSVKMIVALLAFVLALASAAPGGWGGKHEHVVIHVPYHVHTVHHHHVKKVHVPVPVVKKIYIHEPVHHEPIVEHGGWW